MTRLMYSDLILVMTMHRVYLYLITYKLCEEKHWDIYKSSLIAIKDAEETFVALLEM